MGIFNSKNLKKAVNMVASSSPVLYALSQTTDIVDKSMDVIDKNLNGGKNWNFSNEPIDDVAKAFMNGVKEKYIVCMMINISDTDKASVRENFCIDIDEQILFFNDTSFFGNRNQGLVITNKRLVWIPNNDDGDVYSFAFNDIERVEYREMRIYLWGYGNDEDNVPLPLQNFFSFNGETSAVKTDAQKIAAVLNKMVTVAGHEEETTPLEVIESYLDNNEADKAIQCINEILSSTDFTDEDETKSIYYYYLGLAYAQKMTEQLDVDIAAGSEQFSEEVDRYDGAMNSAFREALAHCTDDEFRCKIYYLNALYCLNQLQGRQMALAAMESPDFEIKQEAKDIYMNTTKHLPAYFTQIDYNTRKFIFVLGTEKQLPGCYDKDGNIQFVFTLNDLPASIQFPVGHPQANTLYIGHPFKPATYLPFENATEQLFMERVHELCYLGQCLGANEIRIKRLRGLDTASSEAKQLDVSGELDVKAVNVGGSFGRNNAAQNSYSSKDGMEMVQTYLPTKQPYCPDDLVWLDSETSWQALVKQRLNGNILSYSLHLSSSESVSMTSSKVLSVKASFEYLVTKVSGTYDAKTDKTFSKTEEIEWEIDMQFKPLLDFEGDNVNAPNGQAVAQIAQTQKTKLSEDELAYKEEVEFCLEDASEIDAHSRKFLERKRQKLGLSETRAQEIEDMVKASLVSFTDEEKEYMEALDDVIEDGVIPNNVRRLLERERKSLGISEERAKELEKIKCKA
ncbi:hypothetical protein ST42_00115 [Prevotella pectinovora]|uniref:hypothetical protein n=1 Tax=Prevotella pectinovora TaxID=1602169 RepID=UPI0005B6D3E0|nr:hypothetical protein [Prevotella pectinovora]KIP59185.1 hypothetical protein ST42_00115 [Prevotella pectinovora]